jgi:hypothetical protein
MWHVIKLVASCVASELHWDYFEGMERGDLDAQVKTGPHSPPCAGPLGQGISSLSLP